jgi:hypothetical protein
MSNERTSHSGFVKRNVPNQDIKLYSKCWMKALFESVGRVCEERERESEVKGKRECDLSECMNPSFKETSTNTNVKYSKIILLQLFFCSMLCSF